MPERPHLTLLNKDWTCWDNSSPRKLLIVSIFCGSSIHFTAVIFFGSGLRPFALHWCPKKETCGSLNCILSGFRIQCILPTYFQEIHQVFIMFLVISSIDDHIISYACDSRNAKEYCIQFPLEHILSNNGNPLEVLSTEIFQCPRPL